MWPDLRLGLLVLCLALAGCQDSTESATVTVASGSALVLDPWKPADHTSLQVQRYWLFDTLFRHSPDGRPVAHLAERWDTVAVPRQPDSLDLFLQIRSGLTFHDGSVLTSSDVATTFVRALNPESAFPYADRFWGYSPSVELVDETTLRFRVIRHGRLLQAWTVLPILPHTVLDGLAPATLGEVGIGDQLIGSGPFRFVGRRTGDEWIFRRHTSERGQPASGIERLVYRVRTDHNALAVELLTGAADVYFPVAPDLIGRVARSSRVRLLEGPGRDWTFIVWNGRRPPMSDPEFRRAIGLALDREALLTGTNIARGMAGDGVLPPGHPAFEGRDPAHDPDAAGAALDRLGWRRGADGMRRDASGNRLEIQLLVHSGSAPQRGLAEAVQYQLSALGVDVRIRFLEVGTLVEQLTRVRSDGGRDFEAALLSWSDQVPKDDRRLFHSRSSSQPWGLSGTRDARLDALLDSLAHVPSDADRLDLWRRYRDRMTELAAVTVLVYPRVVMAISDRLGDVAVDLRGEIAGAAEWRLVPPGGESPREGGRSETDGLHSATW